MKTFCLILVSLLFHTALYASALLVKDEGKKSITVKSHLYLYGLVDKGLAQKIAVEINQVWNEGHPQVLISNVRYDLIFKVTTSVSNLNEVRTLAEQSNPEFNFIRIISGPNSHITASFIVGHTNSGVWLKSDNLGVAKTSAHEYGHTLGLKHPEGDSYVGIPRIMITRYYNQNLDLRDRKVLDIDIQELGITGATKTLGQFNRTFFFDEEGNFLPF